MTPRARAKRLLQTPFASLILAAALITSAYSISTTPRGCGQTFGGRLLSSIFDGWGAPMSDPPFILVAKQPDGTLAMLFGRDAENAAFGQGLPSVNLLRRRGKNYTGFWAPTRLEEYDELDVSSVTGASFTAPELAKVRALYVALPNADAARIATADYRHTTILWRGYLHDTGALACLIALAYSLVWIAAPARWLRQSRRITHGLCPGCGYNVKGLPKAQCPECGAELPLPGTEYAHPFSRASLRRGAKKLLRTPTASLIFAALLAASAYLNSTAPRPPGYSIPSPTPIVIRQPDGTVGLFRGDEPGAAIQARQFPSAAIIQHDEITYRGIWAITRIEESNTLDFQQLNGPAFTSADLARARLVYAEYTNQWFSPIASADYLQSTILWLGYLHNTAALGCLAGLVHSLAWAIAPIKRFRHSRRRAP